MDAASYQARNFAGPVAILIASCIILSHVASCRILFQTEWAANKKKERASLRHPRVASGAELPKRDTRPPMQKIECRVQKTPAGECRMQNATWMGASGQQAGNDLSAVPPVDAEVRIGGDHHRIGQGLAQAHEAGVGQAHGHAGVLGAQVEHLE